MVCSKDYLLIGPNEFAYEAFRQVSLHDGIYVIVADKDNRPIGYLSTRDLIRAFKQKFEDETIVEPGRLLLSLGNK